jgi:alanyl-tRNA synthetase
MVAARKLGLDSKTMVDVCISMTIDNMKSYYPYLINQKQHIEEVIYKEEESFSRTINDGFKIIDKLTTDIDGHILFDLFTTYGFPVEMTVEIASEKGIAIKKDAIEEYKKEYKHHQDISRGFIKK